MKENILSENAQAVAQRRYFSNGEGWKECVERVAKEIAMPETNNKDNYTSDFFNMIYNMDFLPGGRILRNAGKPRGSLFNCYHLGIDDSIEEIGQLYKDALTLWSEGGGVGVNFSSLRPKKDIIQGKGGVSSGLVSFMEAADFISKTIESGGARRAAAIAHVDVTHPEVLDFIDAKLLKPDIAKWLRDDTPDDIIKLLHEKIDKQSLSHFNISVAVNHDFLETVERNGDWTFKFKQKSYNTIKAKEIWDKIVSNMINCAEPGLINWTNFSKNNSWYFNPVSGTNPCHTGDTPVALADGRGHVPFKQLAEEEKDVPVFSLNDDTGDVEIQMMRRPRKTGFKEKIFRVYVNDTMYFRSNGSHKITMFDGSKKEVKDLKTGDRLHHMIKYTANLSTVLNLKETKQDYCWMNNGYQKNVGEHRVVAEFNIGRKLTKDEVVHHKDYIYNNNAPENLEVMLKIDHDEFHKKDKFGKNNPIHRFPEKNYFKYHKFYGTENGNSKGYTIEQLLDLAVEFTKKLNRRPMLLEWQKYCEENNYPYWAAEIYHKFGGHKQFFDEVCHIVGLSLFNQYKARSYKKYLEIKDTTDLEVFWDDGIKVKKVCEFCGNEYIVDWGARERSYCSIKCTARNANQVYQKQRVSNLNFYVNRVEEDGYEDVYNGTVDHNHNFYVFVGESKTKAGKQKLNYINSRNCGETSLSSGEACDLGSLVLPNFITGNINTNWKKLETVIRLAVRFLDNVIDVNKYVIKEVDVKVHRSRRIGLGVMGLAEYLYAKKARYGSQKAVTEVERLMRFIRDTVYQASIELASEKGSFPMFEPIAFGKASFIRKLPASIRMKIKKYGIRNCTTMALAPTGTISLLSDVTGGIEPLFSKAFERKDRVSNRIYIHPKYASYLQSKEEVPDWFVDSFDLKPEDHFEIQVACQKYCDASVSKTINLPEQTTKEELSDLLLEYIYDLKGVTVYRDGSRPGQILNKLSKKEALEYLKKEAYSDNLEEQDVQCSTGSCDL